MRKALLLIPVAVLAVAGIAYAANSNVYTVSAGIKPMKSGTKKNPKPISLAITYNIASSNSKAIPTNVKTYKTFIQQIIAKTNNFPACGTSRINNSHQGPSTCRKGSLIGGGWAIVDVYPSNRPALKAYGSKCSLQLSIYNGGNHTFSLYLFSGNKEDGYNPCKPKKKQAFVEQFSSNGNGLTGTFTIPATFRSAGKNVWVIVRLHMTISVKTTKVGKKPHRTTIGLLDSVGCPANHQRQVKVTFTATDGTSGTATRLVPCTS